MRNISRSLGSARTIERFLASLALIVCLVTVARIWQVIGAYQPMWLFPALYFLEIIALSVWAWYALAVPPELSARQIAVGWGVAGAMTGFSILAMWSVGFFLIPVAFLFAVTALVAERRHFNLLFAHLGISIVAALAQIGLMFLIIAFRQGMMKI